MMIFALLLATVAPPPQSDAVIEQLTVEADSAAIENIQKTKPDAAISQLPPMLDPIEGTDEEDLEQPDTRPSAGMSDEVSRAFVIIRARGQEPTPELIAREISPEALQAYLSTNPDARDPKPPEPTPPNALPPNPAGALGVIVIPSPGH